MTSPPLSGLIPDAKSAKIVLTMIGIFVLMSERFPMQTLKDDSRSVRSVQQKEVTSRTSVKTKKEPVKIALMMGFPVSGETLLQHQIHIRTNTSTATMYGQSVMMDTGDIVTEETDSLPLYENEEGPYVFSYTKHLPKDGLVLTRTYCGDHRHQLSPMEYVKDDVYAWINECFVGNKFSSEDGRSEAVTVGNTHVRKYLHLVRNPTTNIAARFENQFKSWGKDDERRKTYPMNRSGFKKWCEKFDDNVIDEYDVSRRTLENDLYLDTMRLRDLSWHIPCHTDFYRFAQFHNMAFDATEELSYPANVKLVQFEKLLSERFGVYKEILEFLGLESVDASEIKDDKTFRALDYNGKYFSNSETANIKEYLELLSTEESWEVLSLYFDHISDEDGM